MVQGSKQFFIGNTFWATTFFSLHTWGISLCPGMNKMLILTFCCFSFKIATFQRDFFVPLRNLCLFSVFMAWRFSLPFLFIISYCHGLKIHSSDAGCCRVLVFWLVSIFRVFLVAVKTGSSHCIGPRIWPSFCQKVNNTSCPIFRHYEEHDPFKEHTLPVQVTGLVPALTCPWTKETELTWLSTSPGAQSCAQLC